MEVGDAYTQTKGRAALRAFRLRPPVCSLQAWAGPERG